MWFKNHTVFFIFMQYNMNSFRSSLYLILLVFKYFQLPCYILYNCQFIFWDKLYFVLHSIYIYITFKYFQHFKLLNFLSHFLKIFMIYFIILSFFFNYSDYINTTKNPEYELLQWMKKNSSSKLIFIIYNIFLSYFNIILLIMFGFFLAIPYYLKYYLIIIKKLIKYY